MRPPACPSELVAPACTRTSPPARSALDPAVIPIAPTFPPRVEPVPKCKAPISPSLSREDPEEILISPLPPLPDADNTSTLPLDIESLPPLRTVAAPPCCVAACRPPSSTTELAALRLSPALTPPLAPAFTITDPASPLTDAPVARFSAPLPPDEDFPVSIRTAPDIDEPACVSPDADPMCTCPLPAPPLPLTSRAVPPREDDPMAAFPAESAKLPPAASKSPLCPTPIRISPATPDSALPEWKLTPPLAPVGVGPVEITTAPLPDAEELDPSPDDIETEPDTPPDDVPLDKTTCPPSSSALVLRPPATVMVEPAPVALSPATKLIDPASLSAADPVEISTLPVPLVPAALPEETLTSPELPSVSVARDRMWTCPLDAATLPPLSMVTEPPV